MPAGDKDFIEWLGSAASGPDALGGKAASLDRLLKLGYRVPPGFCITTSAFRAQLAGPGFEAGAAIHPAIEAPLRLAAAELSTRILSSGAGGPSLAVRSSAIGEDGAAASYAGLHETEVGVAPDDVPGSVQRCWASLWSAAAMAYRARRGLSDADAAMAVVVQALVPAVASAVVFTRHPVTGRVDQIVITAARGLGDAMVAGTMTPDTYVIDKLTRTVVEFAPGEDPRGAALEPAGLAALVDLSLAAEADYGGAVDLEAAIAADGWFLLQARPITTGGAIEAPA